MTALGIALLILVLLVLLLPMGAEVSYRGSLRVRLRIGLLRLSVYPPADGKTAGGSRKKSERRPTQEKKTSRRLPNRRQIAYTLDTLLPALFQSLSRLGRRLSVPVLRLHIAFGGEDPADTALLYGKAQAASAALVPALERLVRVRETDLRFSADYDAPQTVAAGEIAIEARLGALLALGGAMLKHLAAWLRGYRALAAEEEKTRASADAASAA